MKKILIATALLLSSQTVIAEWVEYGTTDSFKAYYKDDSIRREKAMVKVWMVYDYNTSQTVVGGEQYISKMIHSQFDCRNEVSRATYLKMTSESFGGGDIIWSNNNNESEFRPIVPGSILWAASRILCSE